jgi:hypothetical protein
MLKQEVVLLIPAFRQRHPGKLYLKHEAVLLKHIARMLLPRGSIPTPRP